MKETCRCSKCNVESLFIKFIYHRRGYILGGIYRHPNGSFQHFLTNLEDTLSKINNKHTAIITGDMNIDLIKFSMEDIYQYISTLILYIWLPVVYSITYARYWLFCDLHRSYFHPWYLQIFREAHRNICWYIVRWYNWSPSRPSRPYVRLYIEKNTLKFKELVQNVNWDALYTVGSDWYDNFVNLVYIKFQQSFPLSKALMEMSEKQTLDHKRHKN